jgi:histidinol-phosphate/aromatic aminotransferase/cobyric acid decarboxylase-like protein
MTTIGTVTEDQLGRLTGQLAQKAMVAPGMIMPFVDFDTLMPELIRQCRNANEQFISVGHVTADVAIAADRAGLKSHEILGISPFSSHADEVPKQVPSPQALLYVANPNRLAGAGYSLKDLEMMANLVGQGTLIVDEYYFDYYGISAVPLLHTHDNVVILRSFTASFGINSADAGYVIAHSSTIRRLRDGFDPGNFSATVYRMLTAVMQNEAVLTQRLSGLHNEALRLAGELTRLGIQNRLSPTDFLLLRVADVKAVGNFLASCKVAVENLDGYPQLDHCLKYRLQSELSNNQFLGSLRRMPAEHYRMRGSDRRPIELRRPGESAEAAAPIPEPVIERQKVHVNRRTPEGANK